MLRGPGQEIQNRALFSDIVNLAGCDKGWSQVVLQFTDSTPKAKVYVNSAFIDKIGKAGDLDKDIGGFCKDKPLNLELKRANVMIS
ncbi:MAG: hypothetical protein IPK68_22300 [Bdellovibrionales bacterium]|nr:hypothetical protein [Bdellovibrionales bacterium]